jgi:hypothetical protein
VSADHRLTVNSEEGFDQMNIKTLAWVAICGLATPLAAQDLSMQTELGTTLEQVTASLSDMGYEVRKAEMEDGKIEVYFVKDRTMGEVYVSPESGKIIKLEME